MSDFVEGVVEAVVELVVELIPWYIWIPGVIVIGFYLWVQS